MRGDGNGYKQFQSEIQYLVLLVSTCLNDHIEKSINFNEVFVTNQKKKTFSIYLQIKLNLENLINRQKVLFEENS